VQRLPLFPLGTVLLPGAVLPLHVFEERYRSLVQTLLAGGEGAVPEFGVVAIRAGREVGPQGARALHGTGCSARLRRVTPHPDGRYDVVATGTWRFRLAALDATAGTPYLTGLVEPLPERDGDAEQVGALAASVRASYAAYLERVGGRPELAPDPDRAAGPAELSWSVAAAMVLDLPDRQALLERPDTVRRLAAELALLRRERALLAAIPSLPAVGMARSGWSAN
jgi:uncharacterized protein